MSDGEITIKLRRVWGIHEIAEVLGIAHGTMHARHRRGKMPEPTGKLACGPVWLDEDILPWIARELRLVGLGGRGQFGHDFSSRLTALPGASVEEIAKLAARLVEKTLMDNAQKRGIR